MAFLPHHYYSAEPLSNLTTQYSVLTTQYSLLPTHYSNLTTNITFLSPRGEMRLMSGNDFAFRYPTAGMLPFFPAPKEWKQGYSAQRMTELVKDYVQKGSFGADTYWGGKGLTKMMHYMPFAMQLGD